MSRRDFLKLSGAMAGASTLGLPPLIASAEDGAGITWPAGQALPRFAPPSHLDAADISTLSHDEQTTLMTLQGVVNREGCVHVGAPRKIEQRVLASHRRGGRPYLLVDFPSRRRRPICTNWPPNLSPSIGINHPGGGGNVMAATADMGALVVMSAGTVPGSYRPRPGLE